MDVFVQVVSSYPTVIFTVLLAVSVLYWVLAALGLVEIDGVDGWLSLDVADGTPGVDAVDGVSGAMMKFGLGGLPIMLIATVLLFVAWFLSYFIDALLLRHLGGGALRWLLATVAGLGAFVVAVPITSVVLRPLRHWFQKLSPAPSRSLLGRVAVVRSPAVDRTQGSADLADGGAGLILQVRSAQASEFKRGQRVVLVEYVAAENAYRVIGEDELQLP